MRTARNVRLNFYRSRGTTNGDRTELNEEAREHTRYESLALEEVSDLVGQARDLIEKANVPLSAGTSPTK